MASLTDGVQPSTLDEKVLVQDSSSQNLRCHPLKYSGSLDQYYSFQHTPAIGTEFPDLQVSNLLNKDEALRDLAILTSQRGVVFFRNQKLDPDQLKLLAGKLGELTGKPSTSKLHRHALIESQKALATEVNGKFDDEVWVISSHVMRNHFPARFNSLRPLASDEWHTEQVSCIAYENIPADYTVLHMMQNPEDGSGGDTLWASGYEAYNRLSPHFRKMVDEMTVTTSQPRMLRVLEEQDLKVVNGSRGAPENTSSNFQAVHPVVRTNPVTGWKSLYGAGVSARDGSIHGVTKYENDILREYFDKLISQNHDLQVRFKWGLGDLAIWDNRSTYHTGTDDFTGHRQGNRVISLGERPYYDPTSKSQREALSINTD
ncbi:hypothetical protein V2G26_002624 [Clonostachys chloroleuca]